MAFETPRKASVYIRRESVFPPVKSYAVLDWEPEAVPRPFYEQPSKRPTRGRSTNNQARDRPVMVWFMESYEEAEYMFLECLVSDDKVYITDFYGFCAPFMPPNGYANRSITRFYRPYFPRSVYMDAVMEKVCDALRALTGLTPVFYNKGLFKANKATTTTALIRQLATLRNAVPSLCLTEIGKHLKPAWMAYDVKQRMTRGKWKVLEVVIDHERWMEVIEVLFKDVFAWMERLNHQSPDWVVAMDAMMLPNVRPLFGPL